MFGACANGTCVEVGCADDSCDAAVCADVIVVNSVIVLFLFLFLRSGFHVDGKWSASSLLLRQFWCFSISIASLIVLVFKCSMVAMVFVLLKSNVWPVSLWCLVSAEEGSSFLRASLCS